MVAEPNPLRSDNGKVYNSKKFNKFCEEASITHQFAVPYTPQQNKISERRNQYIMEMMRCMLHEKELSKSFWVEAAYKTLFLQNPLPAKALQNKTAFKAWNGFKPSVSFSKIFVLVCFFHLPPVKRDKLDEKAVREIFVVYSLSSKAYEVLTRKQERRLSVEMCTFLTKRNGTGRTINFQSKCQRSKHPINGKMS